MTMFLTCPKGHRWEGPGSRVCPVCGAAAGPNVGAARTEALTIAPEPPGTGPAEAMTLAPGRGDGDPLASSARTDAPEAATLGPGGAAAGAVVRAEALAVSGYRILEELGRGGMGVVYKAVQVELNRPVALKMILSGAHAGPQETARFNREAEAVARLHHPGIVQIYDIGEHEGRPFLALEYVGGGTLAQRLQGQPLPAGEAAALVEALARAVDYAHQHGVVHRDLKPANVLLKVESGERRAESRAASAEPEDGLTALDSRLSALGSPKIADFGLAKRLDGAQAPTQSGTLLGTPSYMAPEQAAGKSGDVGPAVDVYALGAILYELLTGRPPFLGETPLDTVLLVMSQEPARPRTLAPKCPRDLETVCLRCLEKDPKRRYASAHELADDLERFRRGEPIRARRVSSGERLLRWGRRRPLAAACLLLGLCALAWAAVAFSPALYRLATNQGRLVLESSVPGVRVRVVPEDGPELTLDVGEREEVTLPAGKYTLALAPDPRWLELSEDRLTLGRNGRLAVQVRPQPEGEIQRLEGHTGSVHGLAVSPDGRLALSVSGFPQGDASARLWDLRSGKELRRLAGPKEQVLCVAFSADGKRALTGGTDRVARLWDVTTGRPLREYRGHGSELSSVAFSRDGRRILTSSHDGSVRLWDLETGQELELFDAHMSLATWAAFTPDGRQAVSSSHDNTLRVWDLAGGVEVRRLRTYNQGTECVAVSPDGRLAASAGYDRSIQVWDLKSGRLVRRLLGHTSVVSTVAFSPDGRLLVSGGMDRTVRLWEVAGGAEVHCFTGHADGIRAVAFCPDGRRVLSAGGGNHEKDWLRGSDFAVRVWGLPHKLTPPAERPPAAAAEVRRFEGHEKGAFMACVSPDGKRLASSSNDDGTVRLWDMESGQELGRLVGHTLPVYGVAWSADGGRLLTGGRDSTVRLWDTRTGRELTRCLGHQGLVWDVALSPDGRRGLSAGQDKTVRLWDLATGQELCRCLGHARPVRRVALAPDGRSALSCSAEEKSVRIWGLRGAPEPGIGWQGQLGAILACGPSVLAAAPALYQSPRTVQVEKEARLLEGHTAGLQTVALSPDGRLALSCGHDRTVRLWDVEAGQELKRLDGHTQVVEVVQFSADGKRALSIDWGGVAVCWDLEAGREIGFCGAHAGVGTAVAFAGGNRFITASHHDPVLRLWQLPEAGRPAPRALEVPPLGPPTKAPGEVLRFTGHRNPVYAVAVSPDGRHLLTGSGARHADGKFLRGSENELRLWDARTGRELWRRRKHTDTIIRVVLSPDGRQVLSAGADRQARLWGLADGQSLRAFAGHGGEVRAAAWSADGQRVFTGDSTGAVRAFEASSGKLLQTFPVLPAAVWSLALSPDGRRLAAGSNRVIRLADVEAGQWTGTLTGHTSMVREVLFSADGSRLISCGDDATIRQWDVAAAKPAGGVLSQASGIVCMALSRDGRRAVTGAWDGRVRLWDLGEGRELHTFAGHGQLVHGVAFSTDGKQVFSGGMDRLARLWRVPDGQAAVAGAGKGQGPGEVVIVTAHPGAELVVKQGGKVVLPATGKRRLELPPGRYEFAVAGPAEDLRLSPRWLRVAPGETRVLEVRRVRVVRQGPELVRRFEGHRGVVRRVAFSPDGRLALSGSAWFGDDTLRLWDVATGAELRRLEGHRGQVNGVAFSPDGRYALAGGEDRLARLWDVRTGREVRRFVGHGEMVWYVAFDAKGRRVLTASVDRTVRVWDAATGKELHRLNGHTQAVEAAVFSPDGKYIVSADQGGSVRLWDAGTGAAEGVFTGHGGWCYEVAFSPDGRALVGACSDGTLRLWEVATRKEVQTLRGHRGSATAAAFSPDGRRIVSGSLDGTVRLWDAATGQEVGCLRGHADAVLGLALSRDGRYALSGGGLRAGSSARPPDGDFDLRLWALPQ